MDSYTLIINGKDRTKNVSNGTITITDEIGSGASTMDFSMVIRDSEDIPKCDEEIIVIQAGVRIFAGRILRISPTKKGSFVEWQIGCVDYTRDLDRNLVVEGYQNMTDAEIIKNIIDNYCGGTGITYNNVQEGITISNIVFSYMPPSECFSRIAKLTGREWYINYDKDIRYGLKFFRRTPFNIV